MIGLVGIQIDDFEQIETDNSCLQNPCFSTRVQGIT